MLAFYWPLGGDLSASMVDAVSSFLIALQQTQEIGVVCRTRTVIRFKCLVQLEK